MPAKHHKGKIVNPHSHCKQIEVHDVTGDAIAMLSEKGDDGTITLVLNPTPRWACSPYFTVPSGVSCLLQKFGRKAGIAEPGLHFKCSFWRVSHVVSKQAQTYDAPVKSCPTSDNVHVNVNVVVIFKIDDPEKFVYDLGAANFDEYLSGTVDERIRQLVRSQSHKTVYNLRGGAAGTADQMIEHLNKYFSFAGVNFIDVKIVDVELPDELLTNLEETTKTDKLMRRVKRQHEFEKEDISMKNKMDILIIERKKQQVIVGEAGRTKKAQIDFEQRSVKAEEEGMIAKIEAEMKAEVDKLDAENELNRSKQTLESYRINEVAKAEEASAQKRIKGDIDAEQKLIEGNWQEEKMICEAEATKFEATAEEEASKCLIAKRGHELKMVERNIIGKLAEKGTFNLIGTQADKLIQAVLTGSFEQQGKGK